jgi:hypothetical protein
MDEQEQELSSEPVQPETYQHFPSHKLDDDRRWPTLMVIGEMKAGTTALSGWLARQPHTCLHKKEAKLWHHLHLLDTDAAEKKVVEMLDQMPPSGDGQQCKYGMDNTPAYSRSVFTADNLKTWLPVRLHGRMRFILIVREPVERLLSLYNMKKRNACDANTGKCSQESLQSFARYANDAVISRRPAGVKDGRHNGDMGFSSTPRAGTLFLRWKPFWLEV